ncbi:MAG: F0F1 ATP synthase subunit A [Planctomycetota bacterium]|jgi:F-type H+-transporting ATPase subunit a
MLLAAEDPTTHVRDTILLEVGGTPVLTTHTVTILVVSVLLVVVMMRAAKSIATGANDEGNERYLTKGRLGQLVEAIVVYLRDEMLEPVLGPKATIRYLPYLMTVFFFILFLNLFGLLPLIDLLHLAGFHDPWIGGTATSSITVTAGLAFVSLVVIQVHGFRELGVKGWLLHNFGGLVPGPIYLLPVALIVFVVELAGHFIKPAALAIRLFANMVAGHTLMAVLLGFGGAAAKGGLGLVGIGGITLISGLAAVAIMFLELFVAFLQAFIFMFLTAVFISLMSHHDEHEHDEEAHRHEENAADVPLPPDETVAVPG